MLGLLIALLTVAPGQSVTAAPASAAVLPPASETPGTGAAASVSDGDTDFAPVRVGAGGFVTGLSFSDDGATRVVRTDGFGGYRWSGDRWVLYVSSASMPPADVKPGMAGGVLGVAVAPSDSSVAYMAYNDAVYRSTDGARTWSKVLTGVTTEANDDFRTTGPRLVVDPRDPKVVYYGSQLDGMRLTRDGGATWSRVAESVLPAGLVVPLSDKAARGSVTRPTRTVSPGVQVASAGINAIAVDRSAGTVAGRSAVVYAASYGRGVYRSTDGGVSWARISPTDVSLVSAMRVLGNGDVLLTARSNPTDLGSKATIWRYRSGTWSRVTPTAGDMWHGLAADPRTPGLVAAMASGGRTAVSRDFGSTWRVLARTQDSTGDVSWLSWALNGGTNWMSVGEIAFDPVRAGRLWLAEGTGVWYADIEPSSATVAWRSQSRGIEQLVPTGVVAAPGGKPLMSSWDRPLFRSEDPEVYPSGYGPVNRFSSGWSMDWSVSDPDYVVASVASHQWPSDPSQSGYSTDGGRTWSKFASIPLGSTNAVTTFGFGSVAVGAPGNVVWVPSYGKRPHFTVDGGVTWSPIVLPGVSDYSLVNNKGHYVNRNVITADKARPGTFYLYVQDTGIFRSTDGARSWAKMSDNTAMKNTDFNWHVTLKAVPGREGELYLTPGQLNGVTSQPFLHSEDGGRTWTKVPGVTGVTAFGLGKAFPGSDHPAVFVAGQRDGRYGIYRSTDGAVSWTYLTDYPDGRTPHVVAMDGDKDVVGRFYLAIGGSGWTYGNLRRAAPAATSPNAPPAPGQEGQVGTAPTPTPVPTPDPSVPTSGSTAPLDTAWTTPRAVSGTVTSTLSSSGGTPLAGARAGVEVRWQGQSTWSSLAEVTTDARGAAAAPVRSARAGSLRFTFVGTQGLSRSQSVAVAVRATTAVSAARSGRLVRGRLTVADGSAVRGATVRLQRWTSKTGWRSVAARRTTASGNVSARVSARSGWSFRWTFAGDSQRAGATSGSIR